MSTCVDVVVPCYNYGRYLTQCVDSILSQTGVDVRVLIIDDASSDDSAQVGARLAARDARVRFVRHEVNKRNIATYNEGIEWARSELFLLLSADDYLVEGALARAASVFHLDRSVAFLCGRVAVAFEGQPPPEVTSTLGMGPLDIVSGADFIERACDKADANPVWAPTAVIRTHLLQQVGGYDPALPHAGDLELWLRLASLGSVAQLGSVQAIYRRHGANMHYSYPGLANLRQHQLAFESYLVKAGVREPLAAEQRTRYRRGLALGAVRVANDAMNRRLNSTAEEARNFALEMDAGVARTTAWGAMKLRGWVGPRLVDAVRTFRRSVSSKRRPSKTPFAG